MRAELEWKEKMHLNVKVGGHEIQMDASPPFGEAKFPTPKQFLLASMAGCTAMDVISLLKKHKQPFVSLKMDVETDATSGHPQVFTTAIMNYFVMGEVDPVKLNEVVQLSLSKYCSVNAMVAKVVPIQWKAFINGMQTGEGKAEFP